MATKDYYKILGVTSTDSSDTIKKSYKKLALKFHPDKVSPDKKKEYEEKFKEINEAYSTLSDETKRRSYDRGETNNYAQSSQSSQFEGGDLSDIFRNLFRGGSFGNQFSEEEDANTGNDLQYEVVLEFTEAAFGCEKELFIKKDILCTLCKGDGAENKQFKTCTTCNGQGRLKMNQRTPFGTISQTITCTTCRGKGKIPEHKCPHCKGAGIISSKEKVTVKIPGGINAGQTLRVKNGGNALQNGTPGDLFVVIAIKPHPRFTRDEYDISMELPITFSQAALGGEQAVPTLSSEEITIKIEKGTESGTRLRLKGQGIPYLNHPSHRGDQFITLKIKTPKKLTKAQTKLLEELAKLDE